MKKASYMGITKSPRSDIDAKVFHMDPPLEGNEYVLVSATSFLDIIVPRSGHMRPETLIFGCTPAGDVTSWADLGGYVGGLSHAYALRVEGYEIVDEQILMSLKEETKS